MAPDALHLSSLYIYIFKTIKRRSKKNSNN